MKFMKQHSIQKDGQGEYERDYAEEGVQNMPVQGIEAKFAPGEIAQQTQRGKCGHNQGDALMCANPPSEKDDQESREDRRNVMYW